MESIFIFSRWLTIFNSIFLIESVRCKYWFLKLSLFIFRGKEKIKCSFSTYNYPIWSNPYCKDFILKILLVLRDNIVKFKAIMRIIFFPKYSIMKHKILLFRFFSYLNITLNWFCNFSLLIRNNILRNKLMCAILILNF